MNSTVMQTTVQLHEETMHQLTGEANRTTALSGSNRQSRGRRSFTAAEMWHTQRRKRSASDRIRKWSLN